MWHKDWGATVKKRDILAEINAPALDAKYWQSKADLAAEIALNNLARLTADRYIALRKNQAVSEQAISVKVAEAYGAVMHDGLKADLTVPQFSNRHFTAEFLTTARGFNESTRTVVTQFVIENEERDLLAPMHQSI